MVLLTLELLNFSLPQLFILVDPLPPSSLALEQMIQDNFLMAEGYNLTNDITVTAPSGYEVSTSSGSGFGSSVAVSESGGSVASTNIYTRLTLSTKYVFEICILYSRYCNIQKCFFEHLAVSSGPNPPTTGSDIIVNIGQAVNMATTNISTNAINERKPGQSSDDGYEFEEGYYEGRIYVTNAHLRTGDYGDGFSYAGDITLAIRFPNIAIPQGSIINSASLKMITWDANTDDVEHKIYAHDVDDKPTISTSHDHFSNEISGYTKTTAGVDWDLTGVASNTEYTSLNISTVIQEIVARVGWASGQDVKLVLQMANLLMIVIKIIDGMVLMKALLLKTKTKY